MKGCAFHYSTKLKLKFFEDFNSSMANHQTQSRNGVKHRKNFYKINSNFLSKALMSILKI